MSKNFNVTYEIQFQNTQNFIKLYYDIKKEFLSKDIDVIFNDRDLKISIGTSYHDFTMLLPYDLRYQLPNKKSHFVLTTKNGVSSISYELPNKEVLVSSKTDNIILSTKKESFISYNKYHACFSEAVNQSQQEAFKNLPTSSPTLPSTVSKENLIAHFAAEAQREGQPLRLILGEEHERSGVPEMLTEAIKAGHISRGTTLALEGLDYETVQKDIDIWLQDGSAVSTLPENAIASLSTAQRELLSVAKSHGIRVLAIDTENLAIPGQTHPNERAYERMREFNYVASKIIAHEVPPTQPLVVVMGAAHATTTTFTTLATGENRFVFGMNGLIPSAKTCLIVNVADLPLGPSGSQSIVLQSPYGLKMTLDAPILFNNALKSGQRSLFHLETAEELSKRTPDFAQKQQQMAADIGEQNSGRESEQGRVSSQEASEHGAVTTEESFHKSFGSTGFNVGMTVLGGLGAYDAFKKGHVVDGIVGTGQTVTGVVGLASDAALRSNTLLKAAPKIISGVETTAKAIPFVGAAFCAYSAVQDGRDIVKAFKNNDIPGIVKGGINMALDIAMGVAAFIPGLGTAVSLTLAAGRIFSDGLVNQTTDAYTYQKNLLIASSPKSTWYEKALTGIEGGVEYVWEKAILRNVAPGRTRETAHTQHEFLKKLQDPQKHIAEFYKWEDAGDGIRILDFTSGPLSHHAGHLHVDLTSSQAAKISLKSSDSPSEAILISFGEQPASTLLIHMGEGATYTYEWEPLEGETGSENTIATSTRLEKKSLKSIYKAPMDGTNMTFKAPAYGPKVGEDFLPPVANGDVLLPKNFHYVMYGGTGSNTYILGHQKASIYCRGSQENSIHIPFEGDPERTITLYDLKDDGTSEIYLTGISDSHAIFQNAKLQRVTDKGGKTSAALCFGETKIHLYPPEIKKVFLRTEESDFSLEIDAFLRSQKASDSIKAYFEETVIGAEINFKEKDTRLKFIDIFNTKDSKDLESFMEDIEKNSHKYKVPHGENFSEAIKNKPKMTEKGWFFKEKDYAKYKKDFKNWITDYCSSDKFTGTARADVFAINADFEGETIIKNFDMKKDSFKVRNLKFPSDFKASVTAIKKNSFVEIVFSLGKQKIHLIYSGEKLTDAPEGTLKFDTGAGVYNVQLLTKGVSPTLIQEDLQPRTEYCIAGKKNTPVVHNYDTGRLVLEDFDCTRDTLRMPGFSLDSLKNASLSLRGSTSLMLVVGSTHIEINFSKKGTLSLQTDSGILGIDTHALRETVSSLQDSVVATTLWAQKNNDTLTCASQKEVLALDVKKYAKTTIKNFDSTSDILRIAHLEANWFEKIKAYVNTSSKTLTLSYGSTTFEIFWTTMKTLRIQTDNGEFSIHGEGLTAQSGDRSFKNYITSSFIRPHGKASQETLYGGGTSVDTFMIDAKSHVALHIKDFDSTKDVLDILNVDDQWFEKAKIRKKSATTVVLSIGSAKIDLEANTLKMLSIKTKDSFFTVDVAQFINRNTEASELLKDYIPFAYMKDKTLQSSPVHTGEKVATPGHNVFMVNGHYTGATAIQKFDGHTDQIHIMNVPQASVLASQLTFDPKTSTLTLVCGSATFHLKVINVPKTLLIGTLDTLFEVDVRGLETSQTPKTLEHAILSSAQGLENAFKTSKATLEFSGTQGMDSFLINTEYAGTTTIAKFDAQRDKVLASSLDYAWFKTNTPVLVAHNGESVTLEILLGKATLKIASPQTMKTLVIDSDEGAFSLNAEQMIADLKGGVQKVLNEYIVSTLMRPKAFEDTKNSHAETYEGTPGEDELLVNGKRIGVTTVTNFDFRKDHVQIINVATDWFKDPTSQISYDTSGERKNLKISFGKTSIILSPEKMKESLVLKVNDGTFEINIERVLAELSPGVAGGLNDYITYSVMGYKNLLYTKESSYLANDVFTSSLGRDAFIINPKHAGKTHIQGFEPKKDKFSIPDAMTAQDFLRKAAQSNADVVITLDEQNSIVIEDLQLSQLSANHFFWDTML
jgi:hypothetical protein